MSDNVSSGVQTKNALIFGRIGAAQICWFERGGSFFGRLEARSELFADAHRQERGFVHLFCRKFDQFRISLFWISGAHTFREDKENSKRFLGAKSKQTKYMLGASVKITFLKLG